MALCKLRVHYFLAHELEEQTKKARKEKITALQHAGKSSLPNCQLNVMKNPLKFLSLQETTAKWNFSDGKHYR